MRNPAANAASGSSEASMTGTYASIVVQFVDAATNTVGYVGSRTTGSAAGRFALRWKGGPGEIPEGTTPIDLPTRHIWIIGRTLAGDAEDQAQAQALMAQFTLTPPGGGAVGDAGCTPGAPVASQPRSGIALLDAISEATEADAPPPRDDAQLARLEAIGVGPGLRVADAKLPWLSRIVLDGTVKWAERALPQLVTAQQYAGMLKSNGWSAPPPNIGDYGTDYLTRAGVAQIGLGANTEDEAAYRTAFLDARGLPLSGNATYRMRFAPGQEPPNAAFWSLTVYDDKGFLPETEGNLHAVGSSRPPLLRNADGGIEVQFSANRPDDPTINWLPVPEGRFRVYLRVYSPAQEVLDRTWQPPAIERMR